MTNHFILENVVCPYCGSDDFELLETTLDEKKNATLHCIDCLADWQQNTKDGEENGPKPLKF